MGRLLTSQTWFTSLPGHDYFCEVHEDFIEDDFNLTGKSVSSEGLLIPQVCSRWCPSGRKLWRWFSMSSQVSSNTLRSGRNSCM